MGNAGQGLDIVDNRRAGEDTDHGGEGRLEAWKPPLALDGFDESRLLSADVGAGAAVDMDLEIVAAADDVLPEEVLAPSLGDCSFEDLGLAHELTANVNVRRVGVDGIRRDGDSLENHVGVDQDQLAILEGARLRLVGVADHILGF